MGKLKSHSLNIKKSIYIIQIFDKSRNSAVNVSTRNTLKEGHLKKVTVEVGLGNRRDWSQLLFIFKHNCSFHLLSCTYTV